MKIWPTPHSDMGTIVNYNGQLAVVKPDYMLERPVDPALLVRMSHP